MKLSTENNINSYLPYIHNQINKHIDKKFHNDIQNALEAVVRIWSSDTVVKKFTSHKVDHNIRVLYYAYNLLNICHFKLNKTGYYILTLAALLHDFGMQCSDTNIIKNYCSKQDLSEKELEDIIRKNHSKICIDWIKKLYLSNDSECGKLFSLINSRFMEPVCNVILHHTGKELYSLKDNLVYYHDNKECRLIEIILILRLADELDIGWERSVGLDVQFDLPLENKSFFWLHYITRITFLTDNILKFTIETHPDDKDKHDFFINEIYNKFMEKNKPLFELLATNCNVHLSVQIETKVNDFIKKFDDEVYDYLLSKNVESVTYFDNTINVTYEVRDIGEIFDLDFKLLPLLYKIDEPEYAVSKEQAYICAKINPNMTIAAYKNNRVIGYLTLWPVNEKTLNKLLNFEILESDVDFNKDIFTYQENNIDICWYVSGLGVANEERGRKNDPMILQLLIDHVDVLAENILKPHNIKISKIGAVVYSYTSEKLCLKHYGMTVYKEASYKVGEYTPKSVCVDVKMSSSKFIKNLNNILG